MALFRRNSQPASPEPTTTLESAPTGKKDRPTPTRKEAEAARRQRMNATLSKKQSRAAAGRESRSERMKAISAREAVGPMMNITFDHASAVNASLARTVTERDKRAGWPVRGSRM